MSERAIIDNLDSREIFILLWIAGHKETHINQVSGLTLDILIGRGMADVANDRVRLTITGVRAVQQLMEQARARSKPAHPSGDGHAEV